MPFNLRVPTPFFSLIFPIFNGIKSLVYDSILGERSRFLPNTSGSWYLLILPISLDFPKLNSNLECDALLGGVIPPNPAQLLSNGNFDKLLAEARSIYDFIIVDTPPSLLVSDTLSIAHLSDVVLFVTRCNHTDKEVLNFIKDTISSEKVKNVGLVLNGLGATNIYGYGYAYNYSYKYGYNYKYTYNYGYGYGYDSDDDDNPKS